MNRLEEIRQAEKVSHLEVYASHGLYEPGSWLAKPVQTVLDILPLFDGYGEFRALDLGCGVGRNSIPVARAFRHVPCRVDCVDILDDAVGRLCENAKQYGVADQIRGVVSPIEDYRIGENAYDLILAVSALEHVDSKGTFIRKLEEIRAGIRENGMVCLIVNSGVRERDKATGAVLPPQFEVNLPAEEMYELLRDVFSGWEILQEKAVRQRYDIPRKNGTAELTADVVTWVARKTRQPVNHPKKIPLFRKNT